MKVLTSYIIFLFLISHAAQVLASQSSPDSLLLIWNNQQAADSVRMEAGLTYGRENIYKLDRQRLSSMAREILKLAQASGLSIYEEKAYQLLGGIKYISLQYDSAHYSFNQAKNIASRIGDTRQLSYAYNGLGNTWNAQMELDSAFSTHKKALKYARANDDSLLISNSLYNIGLCEMKNHRFEIALEWYEEAQKWRMQLGEKDKLAHGYRGIGALYIEVFLKAEG